MRISAPIWVRGQDAFLVILGPRVQAQPVTLWFICQRLWRPLQEHVIMAVVKKFAASRHKICFFFPMIYCTVENFLLQWSACFDSFLNKRKQNELLRYCSESVGWPFYSAFVCPPCSQCPGPDCTGVRGGNNIRQ